MSCGPPNMNCVGGQFVQASSRVLLISRRALSTYEETCNQDPGCYNQAWSSLSDSFWSMVAQPTVDVSLF